jgi:hypothetical protein
MCDTERKTSEFWNFISKRLKAEAALADWRLMLGDKLDFDKLQRHYLAPTGKMANLITCPDQCNPSCGFRKVCEWEGQYEAVCRERRRKDYNIEKADALFFTVKPSGLLPEITKIFKIIPHIEEFGKEEDTWKLGVVPVSGGKSATIYLTLKVWNHEIMDLIYRLNCEEHKPYILLITARKIIHGTSEKVLNDMGSAFVPLNEVLDFNAQTEFELIRECNLAQLVTPSAPEPEPEPENIFRKCGDAWEVCFRGGETFMLIGVDTGARYIRFLLERPGVKNYVVEIVREIPLDDVVLDIPEGISVGDIPIAGSGAVADLKAIEQYRAEVQELLGDLDAARDAGNIEKIEQLESDVYVLNKTINEAISPQGHQKKLNDPVRNVENSFRNAVNRAIRRINKHDRNFASYLEKTIQCGVYPVYLPINDIKWYFE